MRESKIEIPSLEQLEAERERCRHEKRYFRTIRSTISVIVLVAAVAVLLAMLWLPVFQISGSSMSPTLEEGQIVLAVKGAKYESGDLVAFYYGNKLLVKRVIAGPGDQVSMDDNGNVLVNGVLLPEPYVTEKSLGDCDCIFPVKLAEEHYFLLGDNRSLTSDSRLSSIGCVSEEQIAGKILLRLWPIADFALLGNK